MFYAPREYFFSCEIGSMLVATATEKVVYVLCSVWIFMGKFASISSTFFIVEVIDEISGIQWSVKCKNNGKKE